MANTRALPIVARCCASGFAGVGGSSPVAPFQMKPMSLVPINPATSEMPVVTVLVSSFTLILRWMVLIAAVSGSDKAPPPELGVEFERTLRTPSGTWSRRDLR